MKKTLFILSICSAMFVTSYAQSIPNSGFENWNNAAGYDNPDGWGNTNQVLGSAGIYTVTKGTPGNPGNAYIKVTTKPFMGYNIPGVAICGNLTIIDTFDYNFSGFPYTERPDSLTGNWQYMAMAFNDQGAIYVYLTKWDSSAMSRDTVGSAIEELDGMVMSWKPFSLPISYTDQANPDTALIILVSSGAGDTVVANSYLYLDNLSFDTTVVDTCQVSQRC